ncbi:MAG: ATP-dependent DNA helicase RecG [Syntrophaceae bacterium]
MDLYEILEMIERPVLFASRDGFRNVGQVKGLEALVLKCLDNLKSLPGLDAAQHSHIRLLESVFTGFEDFSVPRKTECLKSAAAVVRDLKAAPQDRNQIERDLSADSGLQPAANIPGELEASFQKLSQPVQYLKGVGPKLAELLGRKNICTIEDLLYFLPRRYEDRRSIKSIAKLRFGERETFIGTVISAEIRKYRRVRVFEIRAADESGIIKAVWFHGAHTYLKNTFTAGRRFIFTGEVKGSPLLKEMAHPDYELIDEDDADSGFLDFRRIVPVYSETEGLHQKKIRRIVRQALDSFGSRLLSPVPGEICSRLGLPPVSEALENAHFPPQEENIDTCNNMATAAFRRLVFDDFFYFELGMALRKKSTVLEKGISFRPGGKLLERFFGSLPFKLTGAQRRVLGQIQADMGRPFQMNRLLQGDVGSGKTVVALAAMIAACENGYQAAIMAPTEILANQHYLQVEKWAGILGLKAALVTGSRKGSGKTGTAGQIAGGDIDIIVGTHALVQETMKFRRLGLAVIDEQHRFGVVQRAALREKGGNPDVLFMTATPIPRTLAMTVYADLDLSVIDEAPPGKKPIRTKVFVEKERGRVYEIIRKEIAGGGQAFIVYPLVEESEALDLKDATNMAGHLQKDIFPEFKVGLIHGRLKGDEKDLIMAGFKSKDINILVSTTVIEVGIDIPEASLMVIEHAERFGLSQLHQLRGRVGRGEKASYCILMTDYRKTESATRRLKVMEQTNDGFKIAEEDLNIRGPGEFMGTRQSGLPDFRVANILRDGRLLDDARTEAFALVEKDPDLLRPEHALLREVLIRRWGSKLQLAKTG